MKGKLLFVAGLGVGYVLGARAGRKRYEQIAAAAHKVWDTPGIQRQVHQVQDFAADKVGDIPGALIDAGKKAVASVASARRDASKGDSSKDAPSRNASSGGGSSDAGASSSSAGTRGSGAAAEAAAVTVGEVAAASASEEKLGGGDRPTSAKKASATKPSTPRASGSADGE